MNDETDPELITAVWTVVEHVMQAARDHGGRLPSLYSKEFIDAPLEQQIAVLVMGGVPWLYASETVETWLGQDYAGGKHHRGHMLPAIVELDRLRWPPTGDRDLWVRFGPDGPPPDLEVAA